MILGFSSFLPLKFPWVRHRPVTLSALLVLTAVGEPSALDPLRQKIRLLEVLKIDGTLGKSNAAIGNPLEIGASKGKSPFKQCIFHRHLWLPRDMYMVVNSHFSSFFRRWFRLGLLNQPVFPRNLVLRAKLADPATSMRIAAANDTKTYETVAGG